MKPIFKILYFDNCFSGCVALRDISHLDVSNLSGVLDFSSCTVSYTSSMLDISYTKITGLISPINFKHNINVSNTLMDAAALNALFTGLPTAGTTNKTITITGTPGAATCNRSIATNKGWVISG